MSIRNALYKCLEQELNLAENPNSNVIDISLFKAKVISGNEKPYAIKLNIAINDTSFFDIVLSNNKAYMVQRALFDTTFLTSVKLYYGTGTSGLDTYNEYKIRIQSNNSFTTSDSFIIKKEIQYGYENISALDSTVASTTDTSGINDDYKICTLAPVNSNNDNIFNFTNGNGYDMAERKINKLTGTPVNGELPVITGFDAITANTLNGTNVNADSINTDSIVAKNDGTHKSISGFNSVSTNTLNGTNVNADSIIVDSIAVKNDGSNKSISGFTSITTTGLTANTLTGVTVSNTSPVISGFNVQTDRITASGENKTITGFTSINTTNLGVDSITASGENKTITGFTSINATILGVDYITANGSNKSISGFSTISSTGLTANTLTGVTVDNILPVITGFNSIDSTNLEVDSITAKNNGTYKSISGFTSAEIKKVGADVLKILTNNNDKAFRFSDPNNNPFLLLQYDDAEEYDGVGDPVQIPHTAYLNGIALEKIVDRFEYDSNINQYVLSKDIEAVDNKIYYAFDSQTSNYVQKGFNDSIFTSETKITADTIEINKFNAGISSVAGVNIGSTTNSPTESSIVNNNSNGALVLNNNVSIAKNGDILLSGEILNANGGNLRVNKLLIARLNDGLKLSFSNAATDPYTPLYLNSASVYVENDKLHASEIIADKITLSDNGGDLDLVADNILGPANNNKTATTVNKLTIAASTNANNHDTYLNSNLNSNNGKIYLNDKTYVDADGSLHAPNIILDPPAGDFDKYKDVELDIIRGSLSDNATTVNGVKIYNDYGTSATPVYAVFSTGNVDPDKKYYYNDGTDYVLIEDTENIVNYTYNSNTVYIVDNYTFNPGSIKNVEKITGKQSTGQNSSTINTLEVNGIKIQKEVQSNTPTVSNVSIGLPDNTTGNINIDATTDKANNVQVLSCTGVSNGVPTFAAPVYKQIITCTQAQYNSIVDKTNYIFFIIDQ